MHTLYIYNVSTIQELTSVSSWLAIRILNNWAEMPKPLTNRNLRRSWRDKFMGFVDHLKDYCSNCSLVGFSYIANQKWVNWGTEIWVCHTYSLWYTTDCILQSAFFGSCVWFYLSLESPTWSANISETSPHELWVLYMRVYHLLPQSGFHQSAFVNFPQIWLWRWFWGIYSKVLSINLSLRYEDKMKLLFPMNTAWEQA